MEGLLRQYNGLSSGDAWALQLVIAAGGDNVIASASRTDSQTLAAILDSGLDAHQQARTLRVLGEFTDCADAECSFGK